MTGVSPCKTAALEQARADAIEAYTLYRTEGHIRRVRLVADTRRALLLAQEPLQEALSYQQHLHIEPGHRVVRFRDEVSFMREQLIEKLMNLSVCGSAIPTSEIATANNESHLLVSPYVPFITFQDKETEEEKSLILDRLSVDSEVALCEHLGLQPLDLLDSNIGFRITITHPLAKYAGCRLLERFNGKTHSFESIEQLVKVAMQVKMPRSMKLIPVQDGHEYEPFCVYDYLPTVESAKNIEWDCVFFDHEHCLYESNDLLSFTPNSPLEDDKPFPNPLHTVPIRCSLLTTDWAKKPLRREVLAMLFTPERQARLLTQLQGAPLFEEYQNQEVTIECLKERWEYARAYLAACCDFAAAQPEKTLYLKLFSAASSAISSSRRELLKDLIETTDYRDEAKVRSLTESLQQHMVPTFLSIACVMYPLLADVMTLSYEAISRRYPAGGFHMSIETILYSYLKEYSDDSYNQRFEEIRSAIIHCSIDRSPIDLLDNLYRAMQKSGIAVPHSAELDQIFTTIQTGQIGFWLTSCDKVCDPDSL